MSMEDLIVICILTFCTKIFFQKSTTILIKCPKLISKVTVSPMTSNQSCIIAEEPSCRTKPRPPGSERPSFTKEPMIRKFFFIQHLFIALKNRVMENHKTSSIDIFEIKTRYSEYCTK